MINFGKYDQKVSFVSFGQVSDGYGGFIPAESVVLDTFASVKQMKGANSLEDAQLKFPQTMVFYVQQRAGFYPDTSMQINYQLNQHVIKSFEQTTERGALEWKIVAVRTDFQDSLNPVNSQNTLNSSLDFTL